MARRPRSRERGKDRKPGTRKPTPAAWKKGASSPNPGGRPKKLPELTALCQQYGLQIGQRLIDDALSGRPGWRESAKILLAYGYGWPKQGVTVGSDPDAPPPAFTIYTGCQPPAELRESASLPPDGLPQ